GHGDLDSVAVLYGDAQPGQKVGNGDGRSPVWEMHGHDFIGPAECLSLVNENASCAVLWFLGHAKPCKGPACWSASSAPTGAAGFAAFPVALDDFPCLG